jgi:hypothetical protein
MSAIRRHVEIAAAKAERRLNRYRRTVLRAGYARGRFRMRTVAGTVHPDALPIAMALWSRPERAAEFLAHLNAQRGAPPLRVMLWNNAPANDAHYRSVAAALPSGAVSSIELRSSRTNFGGIARFFLIARVRRSGYSGPVIMLDDDQQVDDAFVAALLGRYRPRSIAGVRAFTQRGTYWGRDEVPDDGPATYVGTGGCVVDSAIVELPGFWDRLPDRFAFVEDQWMSFCARVAGWSLRKADIPVEFVLQERNQHLGLHQLKEEFFRYLYNARPDLEPR